MNRKAPVKDGQQASKALAQIETDDDEELYEKQKPHHQWAQCRIKYVNCDSCKEPAGNQFTHQICDACAVAICRDCVTAGRMKHYPNHPQKSVGELDWKRPSAVTAANKEGHGSAQVNNITSGTGSEGQHNPAMATPGRQKSAGPAPSSSNSNSTRESKGVSPRKGKGKATAGLGSSGGSRQTQIFLTGNNNSLLTLSTPTKKKKNIVTPSGKDSDPDYDMDTPSNNSSDKEYIPRAGLNRKSSTPSKKGANESASVSPSVNNTPVTPVGLANSRPVRASTIQTYEKMRQANVKKQRDVDEFPAAFGEEENTKFGLKMAACAQNTRFIGHITSAENLTRGDKTDGYAQQGAVYGGNAYLYSSEETQQATGCEVKNRTQTYQHKSLPQLHPGPGPKTQSKVIDFLPPIVTSDGKKRTVAVAAEEAPNPKRQNISSQPFTPVSKAELSAASTRAIKEAEASIRATIRQITPAERDANCVFVTAGLDGLAAAIEDKVLLRLSIAGFRAMQDAEIELRNAIHGAWASNMALTRIKRSDGALAAMQILRGYANLVMMRMQMTGSGLIKNWIDATEKDIQDGTPFVPNELRIETVEAAVQEGFKFKIGETDIHMANVLADMKNSTA
ncbi:hypothetical protein LZ32DRAFT_682438 [Colletotrichum eremochloae]|nr:hypothetical protein LZ32DRAFT_682438 [Colletotrichum eremochloae]